MTTIAKFPTPEDAHLFRAFLGSNGIEAHLLDEHVIQLFWHYSNMLGGVRVVVADEDSEIAASLLDSYGAALRTGPYPLNPVRGWPVALACSLLIGLPLLLFGRRGIGTKK